VTQQNLHFEIIKKRFPSIDLTDIKSLAGNDHFVYVVNGEVTFRFPKIPKEINKNRSEFLKQFSKLSPIPIPNIEIIKDEATNTYYEVNKFLPGISFYPSVAGSFTSEELSNIAQELGKFLSSVHSFSIEEARHLKIDEMNPKDFWEYMEQNENAYPKFKRVIFPHISETEKKWVEKVFADFIALVKENPFQTKVIHSDMWTYHIIVDLDNHKLSGVIDFGVRIADPARDFKAFEYYGSNFVKDVYKSYSLPIDNNFEKRRLFYTAHDEIFELTRAVESGDKEKIQKQKVSLSKYVSEHKS